MRPYSPEFFEQKQHEPLTYAQVVEAINNKEIIEVKVTKCNVHNDLTLNIGNNIIGVVKFENIEYHPDNSPLKAVSATTKVGKHIKVIPLSIEEKNGTYVVECSRRESQKMCYENYVSTLKPGDVIDAYFVKATSYGVFCDIGCGIIAFLYTNNISVTHTVDTVAEFRNISKMKVVIKSIDSNYKIELTHKELLGTWEEEVSNIEEGDVVSGTVLSIEEYGVFIRISQNLSGLADRNYDFDLNVGDTVSVRILKIIDKNMKIKLNIISKIDSKEYNNRYNFVYRNVPEHIDKWVYNTPASTKKVETIFGE